MKAGQMIVHRHPRYMGRRVVTEHYHFDPLQAHHAVGLRPSAIVADAHADDSVERPPRAKPQVAYVEVALLEMLERILRPMVGMPGQMDLAVLADDAGLAIDDDRGVVVARLLILDRQFRVAEVKPHLQSLRFVEQRAGVGTRHLVFEKAVDLLPIFHPPAWKKRGQRQFRVYDQFAFYLMRLAHQIDNPADDNLAAVVSRDRTELSRCHSQ